MKDQIDNLKIIQSYPLFKANQVLRENQLNDIVKYLEQQDRLSRICLMGTGIVCGLVAHWDADNSVLLVSPGTGVTSEGYLVKSSGKLLDGYRQIDLDLKWFGTGEEKLGLLDLESTQVIELEQKSDENEDLEDLTESDLGDKVLVLVLENKTDEDQGLCGNDCDEKGNFRIFITRYILIDKQTANKILNATYDPDNNFLSGDFTDINELFYYKFSASHPVIERFGFKEVDNKITTRLNDISSYDEFLSRYKLIIYKLSKRLETALNEVNKFFSPVFVPKLVTGDKLLEGNSLSIKIQNLLSNDHYKLNIQYVHDYLCDLVHAYEELMEAVYNLVADCPPNIHRYPKFLWIKYFQNGEGNSQFSIYRTPYTQPPVYNGNQSRLSETITLYERLKTLLTGDVFQIPEEQEALKIRLTPSRSELYFLSRRAVPFYYQPKVMENWSPKLKKPGHAGKVYSYHRSEDPPFDQPLLYRMEGRDFLRIEGHVGKQYNEVLAYLDDLRQHYNLSFEIVALKIGDKFDDDLFQFICKDLECEKRKHQEQYEILRNRVFSAFRENGIREKLSNILPENLEKFKYEDFSEEYDKIIVEQQRQNLPSSEDFRPIYRCFQDLIQREEKTKEKHLFHKFALDHPGMEHRGGVPLGGTFILAYIGSNDLQSRTVVADFYLPYSCVSGCVPTSIIAERPRPVLLVSPAVFCEGDTDPTELDITVQPQGGVITGPGYTFDQGKHLFTPSESGINEGTVELKYYIDGGEATYHLTIVKLPKVEFAIINKDENQTSEICQNGGKLRLILAAEVSGGQFTVWNGEEELTDILTEVDGGYILDPMEVSLENDEPITLLVRYAVKGNLCGNQLAHELTIFPVPDADFSFEGEVNEVCVNSNINRVEIIPNQEGGEFTAYIEPDRPISEIILQEEGRWFVNFSAINLKPGQSVQLSVQHIIKTEHGCGNKSEQVLTIWSMQYVDFNLPEQVCQNDQPIRLNPQPEGGTFKYKIDGREVENLIEGDQFFPNRIETASPIKVVVEYSVNVGVCAGSGERTIEVLPVPQVDFDVTFVSRINNQERGEGYSVNITDVQPEDASKYNWKSNSGSLEKNLNVIYFEKLPEGPVELDADFEDELWIELSVAGEICQSKPIKNQVLPAIDSFTLILSPSEITVSGRNIPLYNGIVIDTYGWYQQFFIRATTLPAFVDIVEIELKHDGESIAKEIIEINDDGSGYELRNEEGFKAISGSYILIATPYLKSDNNPEERSGVTSKISFIIRDIVIEDDDNPFRPLRDLSDDVRLFLGRRDSIYKNEFEALGSDSAFARTTAFREADAFLHLPIDSDDFERQYFELVESIEKAAKRSDSSSERKGELFKLMEIATKIFMDREIVKSPDNLSEETINGMVSTIERMEEVGFNRETLKANWAGESLRTELDVPTVELFVRALIPKND